MNTPHFISKLGATPHCNGIIGAMCQVSWHMAKRGFGAYIESYTIMCSCTVKEPSSAYI